MRLRYFARMVLVTNGLFLAGCSTPTAPVAQRDPDAARIPEPRMPYWLYLLDSPHSRLHVEVDAVEGCVPKEVALQQLRDFLSAYCNKPDGIEIVRSDVIPAKAARGMSPKALARKYINGPDKTNASPPAFMYVLFYNYALGGPPTVPKAGDKAATTAPAWRPEIANPYAEVLPYPAIYFNTSYSLGLAKNEILLHEVGHLFGMVSRSVHARNGHCRNPGCQMNTGRDYLRRFRWLPGTRQSSLCPECVAELKHRSTEPPPPNLRFVGAALVRSEADYHVASLPDRVGVLVGSYTDQDCQEFVLAVRAESAGLGDGIRVHCRVKGDALKDPAKLSDILKRVKVDPWGVVRQGAPNVLFQTSAGGYYAFGQYSNAVHILQQATLSNARDDWSYNQLAWIKATCPDASVRNGTEAVSAASKACELTGWKNWTWMDTLAAAHAEAGDFKRAIEIQERALRTGKPADSEQKDMRERLSLYQQSLPFREKPIQP